MKWFKHFLDIIFPRTCEACGDVLLGGENLICINCMIDLPRTNSHIQKLDKGKNSPEWIELQSILKDR
jgi:hypothetical protein